MKTIAKLEEYKMYGIDTSCDKFDISETMTYLDIISL
jgi:hypothetical protein